MRNFFMAAILFALFLSGCGGSDSSSTAPVAQQELESGYLVDANLSGVDYVCGGVRGVTTSSGQYSCPANTSISFYVGSMPLGTIATATNDGIIYPQDLLGIDRNNFTDVNLIKLARFIQSLDDGSVAGVITLSQATKDRFTTVQNIVDMSDAEIETLLSSFGIVYIDATTAMNHLNANMPVYAAQAQEANVNVTEVAEIFQSGDTWKGFAYNTVTSPYTGKVWLDRNLGASQVCSALDDTACYGDYYQWGRNVDTHQESNSTTTATLATDINSSGSSFITNASFPWDWSDSGVDDNGALRTANWSKTDGSSVCPSGYRVPTITELAAETAARIAVANNTDAFNNFLKLPSAGERNYYDGSMSHQGSNGIVWSSSVSGSYSELLYFQSSDVGTSSSPHASGYSVRCLKD